MSHFNSKNGQPYLGMVRVWTLNPKPWTLNFPHPFLCANNHLFTWGRQNLIKAFPGQFAHQSPEIRTFGRHPFHLHRRNFIHKHYWFKNRISHAHTLNLSLVIKTARHTKKYSKWREFLALVSSKTKKEAIKNPGVYVLENPNKMNRIIFYSTHFKG